MKNAKETKHQEVELDNLGKKSGGGKEKLLDENSNNYDIRRATHPFACLFHLLFKAGGFFCYLFLGLFYSNELIQYISVIICNAFDFWTVKNITGRLLVGLRWWSTFSDSGKEIWKFESKGQKNSPVDATIFWTFQFASTCAWAFFCAVNFMTFSLTDLVLGSIGLILSGINLWGYYKCSKDQQKKMKDVKFFFAKKGLQYTMNK